MNIEEIYDLELKYQEVYKRTKEYTRNDFVIELIKKEDEKQELIDYLKKEINKISKEIEHYDLWHETGTDINFLILRKQMFKEILSKIEKE